METVTVLVRARRGRGRATRGGRSIAHEHNWQVSVSESADGGIRFDVSGLTFAE